MRSFVFIVLIMQFGLARSQKMEFRVQFSEPLAVLEFVSHITAHSSPDNIYKITFDASRFNTPEFNALLSKFESINYVYWYEYPQYPYGYKIGGSTYFLFSKNLIESRSIEEFESRSIGIIPASDLAELSKILIAFVPVYREIILEPNTATLNEHMRLIRKKLKETDVSGIIDQVKWFHHSSWSTARPFIINICPTGPTSSMNAFAFYNYAYANIASNQKDIELFLSFMFHEAFHMIYDEQSLEFKNELAGWFRQNPSKYSQYAELLFNEAITTALSSGYLYSSLKKTEMPHEKWYSNRFIASMAVAMYPMTLDYLNKKQQVDKPFIDGYIRLMEEKFPEWLGDIYHIMEDRFIICEDKLAFRAISKTFRSKNISEQADVLDLFNLQKMKGHPVTKMILLPKQDQEKNTELIRQTYPELKSWSPAYGSDYAHSIFLADKTYLIIVNAVTRPAEELLKSMKLNVP